MSFAPPIPKPKIREALPPEWLVAAPETEKDIGRYFDERFSERFEIYSEVYLKHPRGDRLRIDRVLRERSGQAGGLWGVELKRLARDHDSFSSFSTSVAQAVDEAQSRIESNFSGHTDWFGQLFTYVFVFPCLYRAYEFETVTSAQPMGVAESWAQGVLKLAGKWGVGAISYSARRRDWGFFVGGHPFYWLDKGQLTDAGQKHQVGSRKGSAR